MLVKDLINELQCSNPDDIVKVYSDMSDIESLLDKDKGYGILKVFILDNHVSLVFNDKPSF